MIPPDLTQEDRFDGLPFGSRGGAVVPYTFPVNGDVRDPDPAFERIVMSMWKG